MFVLYMSPIAPCVEGEFTMILPTLTLLENLFIVSSSSECITAECPNPPNSISFSAVSIPLSEFGTI